MEPISSCKRIGTREEVYKGQSTKTAGGLTKNDIIEKSNGSRTIYISKKVSEKMKENGNILRIYNPNFKKIQKKTLITGKNINNELTSIECKPTIYNKNSITNPITNPIHNPIHNPKHKKYNPSTIGKTLKLSFKVNENAVKTVFYPELEGMNLKNLKDVLLQEENESNESNCSIMSKNKTNIGEFIIEELPDFDINEL